MWIAVLLLSLFIQPAQHGPSLGAGLALNWRETHLQIDYSAGQTVCVWLVGGDFEEVQLADPCKPGGQILLPHEVTDEKYRAIGRTSIELRGVSGTLARLELKSPGSARLPLIVGSP